MMLRTLIILTAALACFPLTSTAAQPHTQPNLILIVTDDQGWGDLGCHGNPVIDTRHFDALASRGAMLDRIEPQSCRALDKRQVG